MPPPMLCPSKVSLVEDTPPSTSPLLAALSAAVIFDVVVDDDFDDGELFQPNLSIVSLT